MQKQTMDRNTDKGFDLYIVAIRQSQNKEGLYHNMRKLRDHITQCHLTVPHEYIYQGYLESLRERYLQY